MAIKELLRFNADPLLENKPGLQPLSRMLHIALKAVHLTNKAACVRSSQPDKFIVEYQNDYACLAQVSLQKIIVINFIFNHFLFLLYV